jgi:DNA repair protein RecN (Recombination protein N)
MPQVAAFADCHFAVTRNGSETSVAALGEAQRIEELAAMLAGSATGAARQSAQELLERAAARKERL